MPPRQPLTTSLGRRLCAWLVFLTFAGTAVLACLEGRRLSYPEVVGDVVGILSRAWFHLIQQFNMRSSWFWGPLGVLLLAERLVPAKPGQKTLSVGFCQDVVWFLATPVFAIVLVWKFKLLVRTLYDHHLRHLEVDVVSMWPVAVQVTAAILVGDFVNWLIHVMKHKVRVLWYFHSVHHSQTELNPATDYRVHPVEKVLSTFVYFLPLALCGLEVVPLGIIGGLLTWHTAVYHSNIRSNFGVLRYVLVTPQSHRVHHGRRADLQRTNYGVVFSIWDHLFGTQYPGYEEYPDTGLVDDEFPQDPGSHGPSLLLAPLRHLVHPFALILRRGV